MKVAEFFAELVVDSAGSEVTVGQLIKGIDALEIATLGEIGALVALAAKFAQVADQAMTAAVAFQMFESQTGLSSQELQRWQIVAAQANVSAESVAGSIQALQKNLAAIRMGQGNIAPFQILGIGANQDAFGVLAQLRQRLKGVDNATAGNIISQMGLDASMLQVLRLSNEQFAQFAGTARGLTTDQERGALRMRLALTQLGLMLRDLGYSAVLGLGPIVQLMEDLVWVIGRVIAGVRYMGQHFSILGTIWKTLLLGNPFVGLMLLLDDLVTYFRGGNSIIGLAVEGIKKIFGAIEEQITKILPHLPDLERVAGAALKVAGAAAGFASLGIPAAAAGLAGQAASSIVQQNSLTQHIQSTAPADEVARSAAAEQDRRVRSWTGLLLDNQER